MTFGPMPLPLKTRFDAKYTIEPSGCWRWTASTTRGGYGQFKVGNTADGSRTMRRAHRVSWEMHRGIIPAGSCVLHRCDNRLCVNPDHLWLGSNADNLADMRAKGRGRKAHGENHYRAKLTDAQVFQIRMMRTPMLQREIGALFGVCGQQISRILNGKSRVS